MYLIRDLYLLKKFLFGVCPFFFCLLKSRLLDFSFIGGLEKLTPHPNASLSPFSPAWSEYMDYYRTEFRPFVYYFDSWHQLQWMANIPFEQFDYKNVRENGPLFYKKLRAEILSEWAKLFQEMGYLIDLFPE